MTPSTLIQIIAACVGIVGSLFFAIGVMRQSVEAMAKISGTYFSWNRHMVASLAEQKADYLFGGGLILGAFSLQLVSFLVPNDTIVITSKYAGYVPWLAVIITVLFFVFLRLCSKGLSSKFESQIMAHLEEERKKQEASRK